MKRREFLKYMGAATVAATVMPTTLLSGNKGEATLPKAPYKWQLLGSSEPPKLERTQRETYDIAVIGAGMAGISAAVAAARQGAKVVLINDRPVLGGNASSEIRVTVNGVQSLRDNAHKVERETGIVEEILLDNKLYNQQESYPVWDHILYNYVYSQPNLTLMLNTQAIEAIMKGKRIVAARCWQLTTETEFIITAKQFIDCSGDGLLAASAGAEFRVGREGKAEFNESYAPDQPDGWVMGDTIMMISRDMGRPMPFVAPSYAIPYKPGEDQHRKIVKLKEGFWWVELGSDVDIVGNSEQIRHNLMAHFYGVWDYVKNSGKYPAAANLAIDWVGSYPGRRESRRFMGPTILTQNDLLGYRHFEDAIGYGGWSLDEHCPGGILRQDLPASYFHEAFTKPYEVPYSCLYSRNIENLSFAGRNASVSHIALSSTRIIGTCCCMGQATGVAAAICVERDKDPKDISKRYIDELQERMLREDYYIPNRPAADERDKARKAKITASSTSRGDVELLTDGVARDEVDKIHSWESAGLGDSVTLEWKRAVELSSIEIKCNSNLQRPIMMHKDTSKNFAQIAGLPPEMVKSLEVEVKSAGQWRRVGEVDNNMRRLIKVAFPALLAEAVRIRLKDTYGSATVRLFEVRCY